MQAGIFLDTKIQALRCLSVSHETVLYIIHIINNLNKLCIVKLFKKLLDSQGVMLPIFDMIRLRMCPIQFT